jgi:hypothetical protein
VFPSHGVRFEMADMPWCRRVEILSPHTMMLQCGNSLACHAIYSSRRIHKPKCAAPCQFWFQISVFLPTAPRFDMTCLLVLEISWVSSLLHHVMVWEQSGVSRHSSQENLTVFKCAAPCQFYSNRVSSHGLRFETWTCLLVLKFHRCLPTP